MRPRRRLLLGLAAAVLAMLVGIIALLHLPAVQARVWRRVVAAVEASTGWRPAAEDVALRGFPARLVVRGLTLSVGGRTVLGVDAVEARWRWRRLLTEPRRIESLVVEGPTLDLEALPAAEPGEPSSDLDPWRTFEIGTLRVSGAAISGGARDLDVEVAGLDLGGSLVGGRAEVAITADRVELMRLTRTLDLGRLDLEAAADRGGVAVQRLSLAGAATALDLVGELATDGGATGEFEVEIEADLPVVAEWWDPNLVSGLSPEGRLDLVGSVAIAGGSGLEAEFEHRGAPLQVAGYALDELRLGFRAGRPTVAAAGKAWGTASVEIDPSGVAELSANLERAPVDRLLGFVAPQAAQFIRGPAVVSGEIAGRAGFPVDPDDLEGRLDLVLEWADGSLAVAGAGAGLSWQVDRFEARAVAARVTGSGSIAADGAVQARLELAAPRPAETAAALGRLVPAPGLPAIAGGAIAATATFGGSLGDPTLTAALTWDRPEIEGRRLRSASLSAEGDLEQLGWTLDLEPVVGTTVTAEGAARPQDAAVDGSWRLSVHDLGGLAAWAVPELDLELRGELEAEGTLQLGDDLPRFGGTVAARAVGVLGWVIDDLQLGFAADPSALVIRDLGIEAFGGTLRGALTVELDNADHGLAGAFAWQGLDLGRVPLELPPAAAGFLSGELSLGGSVARPEGAATLAWTPHGQPSPLLEQLELRAELREGILELSVEDTPTAAGRFSGAAAAPLGGLPGPDWLWPDAPAGPVRGHLEIRGFRSQPLLQALGQDDFGVGVDADLRLEFEMDPQRPQELAGRLEAYDLRARTSSGDLVADGPAVATIEGARLELQPLVLTGLGSRIEAGATYRPDSNEVVARVRSTVSGVLAQLLPLPLSVRGPVSVDADIRVPAVVEGALAGLRGTLTVDHRGGSLVMRDPPVEVRDLQLGLTLRGGTISFIDGSAEVNRGAVEFGGGWDPSTGQGVVLDLDGVNMFTAGVLTRWDGELAVEPHPGRLAMVVGDLNLAAGLWDEDFSLSGAFLGGERIELASDDPLHEIGLDLDVRGRTGIRVNNNLGRLHASWDVLRVGGNGAEPRIRGEVRISPGGVIVLGGTEVAVRRGSLRFTGDPSVDPLLEIVPESDLTLNAREIGGGFDLTAAATRGLATGLTSVLGFENTTLRPADIAVQTEKDPSTRFMVGQRLSRNLALFLAANLTDVQDVTTMLQAWNFPGLEGLVGQVYQETIDNEMGVNVLQRFRWGGSRFLDERPEIRRLRFEGEWPMSERALRRSTRLRRGQPYDPFLLFVAAVRMERALAGVGYQEARVDGVEEGPARAPSLVFTVEPGPRTAIDFVGHRPAAFVQREATALYRPPPFEEAAFAAMRALLDRQLAVEGFPYAEIEIERRDGAVTVRIDRGQPVKLVGPVFVGSGVQGVVDVGPALASPAALATMVQHPEAGARAVERELAARGFLDARVTDIARVAVEAGVSEVRVSVDAGRRRVISELSVKGEDPLGLVRPEKFPIGPGDPLDRRAIDFAVHDLRGDLNEAGYREAEVRWSLHGGDADGWRLEVELAPGRLRTLREVRFAGHRDVSPRVLAKGLGIAPGDVVTDREIDRSASNIANFAPVERLEVRSVPVGPSQTDLEFEVFEKQRWVFEVGGGWSTEAGASATFGARDGNLLGRGLSLSLRGSWAGNEQLVFMVGTLPPAPGGRISLISTLGYTQGDSPDQPDLLAQDELLASLEAQYAVTSFADLGLYYRWTETHTYEKAPDEYNPRPVDVTVGLGVLGVRTVIDRLDNLFDPRSGWALTSDLGWSGQATGSDFDYLSSLTNFGIAQTPFKGATWLQTVRVGVAEPLRGQNLIRDVRFFAGGQSSIRGFDLNSVGPTTFGIDFSLVPAGGGALIILNEELRVPVWGSLRAAVFADLGQVWESWSEAELELAIGAGVGLRWSTPIGPLWADVSWPVANVGISSKKAKFYLGIGRPF